MPKTLASAEIILNLHKERTHQNKKWLCQAADKENVAEIVLRKLKYLYTHLWLEYTKLIFTKVHCAKLGLKTLQSLLLTAGKKKNHSFIYIFIII